MPLIIPERIGRIDELAHNLWWSWRQDARGVFRTLDYPLWVSTIHNPVKQLREMTPENLGSAASNFEFQGLYDFTLEKFDRYMNSKDTWFDSIHPEWQLGPVSFFSMEFAIHRSLPIYAGGLGILAGDICKEASDLGIPMVGVGLMYPQGYFQQRISPDGWQEEECSQTNYDEVPVSPVYTPDGNRLQVTIQLKNRTVYIEAWKVLVGRTTIYLLNTDTERNSSYDCQLASRLYIADQILRLEQEVVLGVGGVRVLRALGIDPVVWHANEGHTAFMMLERIREYVEQGLSFEDSLQKVQANTVFTTHTPVPAGHDEFPVPLVRSCFEKFSKSPELELDSFLRLGQTNGRVEDNFNMTAVALRLAGKRNGVSELHGAVSRRMWQVLWPAHEEDDIPISHVTNGVHVPTWVAPEMVRLYNKYIAEDWMERHDDAELMNRVMDIPDEELWAVRQTLKRKLLYTLHEYIQRWWANGRLTAEQLPSMGALLHPGILTIGFVRRFAEYKRPALIFKDTERLKKIITTTRKPVQIIFAGKSHPADYPAKELLQNVYLLAKDRAFEGRIAFVEDYDIHMAQYLVHGVDLWLNIPKRLREACGTSGMKASINGVPHLSIRDGWWDEAYNGSNGWAIGDSSLPEDPADEDRQDADELYRLLEEEIVPLYYDVDEKGVPHRWLYFVKEAIRTVTPAFSARRMMKRYAEEMYAPAAMPGHLQDDAVVKQNIETREAS